MTKCTGITAINTPATAPLDTETTTSMPRPIHEERPLPARIERFERVDVDVYSGPLEDLIAAGLVRRDQLPEPGKLSISWSHGKRMRNKCKKDEAYLAVQLYHAVPCVCIGVSPETRKMRKEKQRREWADLQRAEAEGKQAAERKEAAERAKRELQGIYKTEQEYRLSLLERARRTLGSIFNKSDQPEEWHGYRFESSGVDSIMLVIDAITEAVMSANVIFDAERHEKLISGYRALIRAADPAFERQFATLTKIDVSILQGECQ
ncbi:hypothetical protein [Ottowia thiooxydans]|uniref:hypothetical protein n=1 Tax=Ottowia thiooxydans TaxID=219182 RepID=UPI00048B767D|nr:hypothetical protein [Ottowia thiooxydans]